MKTSEASLLFVPGAGGGADHWLSRWHAKLSTARRVEHTPDRGEWVAALVDAVAAAEKPAVIIAHGLGCHAAVFAAGQLGTAVRGAMLVAPPAATGLPRAPLPFPSLLFASRNDPACAFEDAGELALAWGSALVDAGEAGQISSESGHGPWPEGLMRFAGFLARL
jgi:uncharacterized protein